VAHLPHERLTNADYDKTTKGKAKTTSTSTSAPTATKSTTSTSKKKKNNGGATSTLATAGANIPKTEPQELPPQQQQQQYLPVPQPQQLPQLQSMIPPPQPQNELLQSYPNTIETPKSLFPEMPFTPLTPNTSAVIESIMNGATNPARVSTQQQIPSIGNQLLPPPGMNQPYMNQQNMMQPQLNNPSQSDMQFIQQQHLKQQQLQAQLMQQTAQPTQQQFQQYQQSGKRKSFDAGIRDDDSPSTKRRKSAGIGLSIVVPDSNQIPLRRVEQDNSQPVPQQQQPSDDNDMFTAPQPVDKSKQSGNSSENLTPMNSGVFSPTDEKSPMPLHLSTPTSLSAMEWPSPTSAFCSLSKNKKDIISS